MGLTVGDGITIAAILWYAAWFLSKCFPLTFGGSIEEYLAMRRHELEIKHKALAKVKADDLERRKAVKAAREAAEQSPFDDPRRGILSRLTRADDA